MDLKYDIVKYIATLSEPNKKGWRKELNLVSWNGRAAKYDIREWSEDHTEMGKGVTLSEEELNVLVNSYKKDDSQLELNSPEILNHYAEIEEIYDGDFVGKKNIKVKNKEFDEINTLEDFYNVISKCWCEETFDNNLTAAFNENNISNGQSDITAALVYNYFGGEICRIIIDGEYHYFNILNGRTIDLTSSCLDGEDLKTIYDNNEVVGSTFYKYDRSVNNRYELLKDKFKGNLMGF